MDNTLVLVFSDNGASAEGGKDGSVNEHRFTAHLRESMADNLAHYDDWGGFTTYNHYSWAWAWAGNTPHKLWKRYTWLGGTRTPLIVHWAGRDRRGRARCARQFAHAIDLMPTIMAAVGLDVPDEVDGVAQQAVDGVSLLAALEDPAAAELHHTQYFEMMGSRSIYHDGWKATTNHISTGVLDEEELAIGSRNFDEDRWELFDLSEDFSEANDRADEEPERVRQLRELWAAEAERNHVLPISDGLVDRFGGLHPAGLAGGLLADLPARRRAGADESVPLLWGGFRMTADIEPDRAAPTASSSPSATGSGATRSTSSTGAPTSPSPGRPTCSSWPRRQPSAAGRHGIGVPYTLGQGGAPAGWCCSVDDAEVDETAVEGHAAHGLQHGGAGLRLGRDSGFPVSRALRAAGTFSGTVHQVRIDTPGAPHPTRPTRCGPRCTPTDGWAATGQEPVSPAAASWRAPGARGHGGPSPGPGPRSAKTRPPAGPNGARAVELLVAERAQQRSSRAPFSSRSATVSAGAHARRARACAALAPSMSSAVSVTPVATRHRVSQRRPLAWPSAM